MEYCPDCVVKLIPQSKKLGHENKWLVCPKCGFRTCKPDKIEAESQLNAFIEYKDLVNANGITSVD